MSTVRELMNDWGRGFLAEKFGDDYKQSGDDIDFREEQDYVSLGCDTCGGYTDYAVEVADWSTGKYASYTGSFADLIEAMSKGGY